MAWIQLHSFALLITLVIAGALTPVIGNAAILWCRAKSVSPIDGYARAARWLAAKTPLVTEAVHFAADALIHPEQLARLGDVARQLEDNPSPANVAITVKTIRAAGRT